MSRFGNAMNRFGNRKPFWLHDDEIPDDKVKVVARLDKMKSDNWRALETMSMQELDDLQSEAFNAVAHIDDFGFVDDSNPHDATITEACHAINRQKRINTERLYARAHEQDSRRSKIFAAANHIMQAAELLETAQRTELDPSYYEGFIPRYSEEIDLDAMSDGDLRLIIKGCNPATISKPLPDYSLLAMLNTPEAKAIAAEAKEQNRVFDKCFETSQANLTAAKDELERREVEAAKSAVRKDVLQENLDDVIAELQGRIAELEASK